MTSPASALLSSDIWSRWLLHQRHGDNPTQQAHILDATQAIRDRVLDNARLGPGMALVDVGSGDGLIAFGALQRVNSLHVTFTDISAAMLEHTRQLAESLGLEDRCSFLEASAETLEGVPSDSADVVTSRSVLAYVPDKALAFRQLFRVLRPGGRISLAEPVYQDDAFQLMILTNHLRTQPFTAENEDARLIQRCRAFQMPSTLEQINSNPVTNYSERQLVLFCQQAGFDSIHLELHIDIKPTPAMEWDAFIDIAPRPGVPTLREIFEKHLTPAEVLKIETWTRPPVEAGEFSSRALMAYLTAAKPVPNEPRLND